MTIKEMYSYKNMIFLREETPTFVNYYYMVDDNKKNFWGVCTQYDFLQAKYYGKPVKMNNNFPEQKESIK